MDRQVVLLLGVQLSLPELVLVHIVDIGRSHLLEQLGTHLLHHALIYSHIFGDNVGWIDSLIRLAS